MQLESVMDWTVLCSPLPLKIKKVGILTPNSSQCDLIWRKSTGHELMRVNPMPVWLGSILWRGHLAIETDIFRGKTVWSHREKATVHKPRREATEETNAADTWPRTFSLWNSETVSFHYPRSPSLWFSCYSSFGELIQREKAELLVGETREGRIRVASWRQCHMDSDRLTQKDWWNFSLQLSISPSGTCFRAEDLEHRRLLWGKGWSLQVSQHWHVQRVGTAMRNSWLKWRYYEGRARQRSHSGLRVTPPASWMHWAPRAASHSPCDSMCLRAL